MGSSRCGRIIAAFIETLEFGVSSNDNSCLFSESMNWKPGLFLLRALKRGFQLTTLFIYVVVYFNSKFLVDKFPGVVVIAGGSKFVSGDAGDISF